MIIHGDAIEELRKFTPNTIDTVFTSPNPPLSQPIDMSIVGGENTTVEYITHLMVIIEEIRRVLKDTGSFYLHMGDKHDTTSGCLMLIPEQIAMFMVNNGWILRDNNIWHRTERIDERNYDRSRHRRNKEYVFRFTKHNVDQDKVYFNTNGHSYWRSSVFSYDYKPDHKNYVSGLPYQLVDMAIKESCPKNGIILDPMAGVGTTGEAAKMNGRAYIMIDTKIEMVNIMRKKLMGR